MVGIPAIGLFLLASVFYNRSSAVVARASVSRGRQANPVLTYETALRRFFAYGGVLRRWGNPMGEATADGGEVAYLRHAEVGVEENPGTLRCALRTGLRKSAVALRRESANRPCVDVYNRSSAVFSLWR